MRKEQGVSTMKKAASTARTAGSPAARTRPTPSGPRRREWRFLLPLTAVVEGRLPDGSTFREKARLDNISSGGAFFQLASSIVVGSKFDLFIDLPKSVTGGRKVQLKVGGKAVRLERPREKRKKQGVAVRFGKGFGFVADSKK
jgi:hypothetical protein